MTVLSCCPHFCVFFFLFFFFLLQGLLLAWNLPSRPASPKGLPHPCHPSPGITDALWWSCLLWIQTHGFLRWLNNLPSPFLSHLAWMLTHTHCHLPLHSATETQDMVPWLLISHAYILAFCCKCSSGLGSTSKDPLLLHSILTPGLRTLEAELKLSGRRS